MVELVDWIATHPDQVSLLVAGGGGPASELEWRAERSRPLASTFKLLVLAEYAVEVAAGRLDPEEKVARADVGRWHLAGTDGGAHEEAMTSVPADDDETLSLDQIVRAMIEFSDNAATDYLLVRLGRERVLETAALVDVEALGEGIVPIVGALLTVADDGLGDSVEERIGRLRALPIGERAELAWRLAAYNADTPEAALVRLVPALQSLGDWDTQLALIAALPLQGSACELAAVVGEAIDGKALGPKAASIMARHLAWPMANPEIAARSASRRETRRGCGRSQDSHGRAAGRGKTRSESSCFSSKAWTPPPGRRHRRRCLSWLQT